MKAGAGDVKAAMLRTRAYPKPEWAARAMLDLIDAIRTDGAVVPELRR